MEDKLSKFIKKEKEENNEERAKKERARKKKENEEERAGKKEENIRATHRLTFLKFFKWFVILVVGLMGASLFVYFGTFLAYFIAKLCCDLFCDCEVTRIHNALEHFKDIKSILIYPTIIFNIALLSYFVLLGIDLKNQLKNSTQTNSDE